MWTRFFPPWRLRRPKASARQSGAIPYAVRDGRVLFLLVTSRKSGRWIFPKGGISTGLTAWDSAAKEALEEAGVRGDVHAVPAGTYRGTDKGRPADIVLYRLRVHTQLDTWQEQQQRFRHWAVLEEAKRLVNNSEVAAILDELEYSVLQSESQRSSV